MKQRLVKIALISSFILAGLTVTAFAQPDQIVGGYGDASVKSKDIKQAAAVAIRAHSKRDKVTLVRIVKAEQQVVSGMNYRVCLSVRGSNGHTRRVTAVVYEPIRKRMRLTNWSNGGCKEL